MKKIGIDARFFTERATGVGRHVYELVQGLAKIDTENEYTVFLKAEEFDAFEVPAKNFKKELTTAKHYSLEEQTSFLSQLNKHNFHLMVFPQFNAPVFYNKPFVVTIHDLTLHLFPGKKKTDFLSRFAYKFVINQVTKKAKHCFAVSENTKRDMMQFLGTLEERITVTYNGINKMFEPLTDEKILREFKQEYSLPDQYFLYTGVFRSHKNILGLIEAYNIFLQKNPESKIHLVLAGPPDSPKVYHEVPELIEELGLKDRIQIQGIFPKEEIVKLICGSVAYVFPSFYEGFGIPPIEAMQCGVPVACSNTSSLPEVYGDAALAFDPYNIEEMAESLEKILDPVLREDLVQKGFKQSIKFKWEDMVKKMFEVYKNILND